MDILKYPFFLFQKSLTLYHRLCNMSIGKIKIFFTKIVLTFEVKYDTICNVRGKHLYKIKQKEKRKEI